MSPFLLIPLLFLFFTWIFYRWNVKVSLGLSASQITLAFGLKVIIGFAYGYIFLHWYHGDDTWYFNSLANQEYEKLISTPLQFFKDFSPLPAFERNPTLKEGWYFYLSELELALITKPLALFHFLSGGNYYSNVLLFNFFCFWPMLWLYRLYLSLFPHKKTILYITLFLIPSLIFWISGIRGDGYLMLFLVLTLVQFNRWVIERDWKAIPLLLTGILGIIAFRSVLLFLLVPAGCSWFLVVRYKFRLITSLTVVYGLCVALFFGSTLIAANGGLPNIIVERQQAFFRLKGNTRYELDSLQPTVKSFVTVLPQSLRNTFLRPHIWEWKGALQGIAATEIILFFLLVFLAFWKPDRPPGDHFSTPVLFFPLVFGISLYVFLGFTTPFPGAIIRYKIPGEWFLVLPLVTVISWKKIIKLKK